MQSELYKITDHELSRLSEAQQSSVKPCDALRRKRAFLRLRRFNDCLRGGQLRTAGRQLRRKVCELRIQIQAQFLNHVFQPVIGHDLFSLAPLHGYQRGHNNVGKKLHEGIIGIAHGKILREIQQKHLITTGQPLVMESRLPLHRHNKKCAVQMLEQFLALVIGLKKASLLCMGKAA
jgi:hypothetical protein